jgi:aminopeptidase N
LRSSNNMTDTMAALQALANTDCPERETVLTEFEDAWRHEPLVMDKWFSVQAASHLPGTLGRVRELTEHAAFDLKNPNRVRAVLGVFCLGNPTGFHAQDGSGYRFLGDWVLALDPINPQVAARLMGEIIRWRRYDDGRRKLMKAQLKRIVETDGLSPDVYELAAKSLE